MDCSMPSFPVLHCLLEYAQNSYPLSQRYYPTISSSVALFSSCPQSFPVLGSFPMSWLFASGGQSIAEIYLPLNLAKCAFGQHTHFFPLLLAQKEEYLLKTSLMKALSVKRLSIDAVKRDERNRRTFKTGLQNSCFHFEWQKLWGISWNEKWWNDTWQTVLLGSCDLRWHCDVEGTCCCLKHLGREGSEPALKHWLDSWSWIQSFRIITLSEMEVAQSCPTLSGPMDYTVHGILQARILEWVAFPFSRGSSQPRDRTQVSRIAGRFFTSGATREAQQYWSGQPVPSPGDLPDPVIKLGSPALKANNNSKKVSHFF